MHGCVVYITPEIPEEAAGRSGEIKLPSSWRVMDPGHVSCFRPEASNYETHKGTGG